jgi:5'-3' exonuclease
MSKRTFIIVDTHNLFHRAKHSTRGDVDMKIGMAFHIMFMSLRKMWTQFDATHIVFANEGHSWRYKASPIYKATRKAKRLEKSVYEQEEDEIMFEALGDLIKYLDTKTNSSLVQCPTAEADDVIALFCQSHPDDNHIIISSDSDFVQLLDDNVSIYDGVMDRMLKKDGVYNAKGKKVEFTIKSDSKIKTGDVNPNFVPERPDWMDYSLFIKCVRGDSSDNVMPAYPGARLKGTKNKVGITEAYDDRNSQGWDYNNFMLQKWIDHEGNEIRVRDRFEENSMLIDLTKQPTEIKYAVLESIDEGTSRKPVPQVGVHFLKFCSKWDLQKLAQYPNDFAQMLNAKYERTDT